MMNRMALDVLHQMTDDGLNPTHEDVIRLNSFGLAVDEAQGKRADDSIDLLPRVAVLVNPDTHQQLAFRQPSVGHEIWLKSTLRFCRPDDYETILALNCFALSRPASALPDALDPSAVQTAAASFAEACAPFTRDVLYAAVSYARFGVGEPPLRPKNEHSDDNVNDTQPVSEDHCVAIASLVNGVSILWGLSLADMKELTSRQLREATRTAIVAHGLSVGKDAENEAIDTFNRVADEIRERLQAVKYGKLNHT